MLEFSDLSFSYGKKQVVSHLSFRFPEKGIVALSGPSGCGKTTLFRLIAGLEKPSGGKVLTDAEKISVVFQEPRLLPFFSVEKNVELVLKDDPAREEKTLKALSDAELSDARDILPGALSGGMKQRAALARALAFDGDLFLLDEPFSALDDALKARLFPRIKALAEGRLVLLVTHDKEDAVRLGAKVLYLTGSPVFDLSENA